jgi:hypothetical protein
VRRRRLSTAISGAVGCAAALALASCAAPGYNPTRIESELVKAGTTPQQAQCVAGDLPNTFDLNQLGSHSAPNVSAPPTTAGQTKPNENEYELARDVLKKCGVTLPLNPIPQH